MRASGQSEKPVRAPPLDGATTRKPLPAFEMRARAVRNHSSQERKVFGGRTINSISFAAFPIAGGSSVFAANRLN